MKKIIVALLLLLGTIPVSLFAQVEKVIVETYYVSDYNDATDTTGGILDYGTTTYRVYIQLTPGSKLLKIYGDQLHALKISSTMNFFNNSVDGQTFAKEFSKNRLSENTVALDTWLTLGQTTRVASKTYFGVLKSQDDDGSFIGGVNNDGGSLPILDGLIANADPAAGIPVTLADGMDTMTVVPSSWGDYGIIGTSGIDSTIFGSVVAGSSFESYNAGLQNSGVSGVNPDSNQVLVAQLTTKGDISFELNVLIDVPGLPKPVKYVSKFAPGDINSDTLKLSPYLTYPPTCGCINADYFEYSPNFGCSLPGACKTLIKFGCKDSAACNFDPDANFDIPIMCCYPGYCNDRDLELICPPASGDRMRGAILSMYPNPANSSITVEVDGGIKNATKIEIYNGYGSLVQVEELGTISGIINHQINISELEEGIYVVRILSGSKSDSQLFVKKN